MKFILNTAAVFGHLFPQQEKSAMPNFCILPETACILKHLPYFLPEAYVDACALVQFGAKINRLGKHIQTGFASRYYDELLLIVHFFDRRLIENLRGQGLALSPAFGYDYCLMISSLCSKFPPSNMLDMNIRYGEESTLQKTFAWQADLDALIGESSKFFTLKHGDIVLTGQGVLMENVLPEKEIYIQISDGSEVLCKIK